ncbi:MULTISPECIES: hypothetical protein [unclassified Bradyrhizobium]
MTIECPGAAESAILRVCGIVDHKLQWLQDELLTAMSGDFTVVNEFLG